MFSFVGEGGIEGEGRRKYDGHKIEGRVVIVPGHDDREMDQGVGGEETGAGHRRRPICRPPCPRGQRKAGDEECRANILDEVRCGL